MRAGLVLLVLLVGRVDALADEPKTCKDWLARGNDLERARRYAEAAGRRPRRDQVGINGLELASQPGPGGRRSPERRHAGPEAGRRSAGWRR
jgi:hypothetical protein